MFKEVRSLSGGERSRLELALLGIQPSNLLLLDEPTNHLDIPAREAIEAFMRESPATLLVVSHDRRLLETVCDRLWVVDDGAAVAVRRRLPGVAAGGGRWLDGREGSRSDGAHAPARSRAPLLQSLRAWQSLSSRRRRHVDGRRHGHAGPRGPAGRRRGPRPGGSWRSCRRTRIGKQKAALDAELTRLGLRKNHLELAMGDPSVAANFVELRRVTSELADVDAALAAAEDAWLELEERAP